MGRGFICDGCALDRRSDGLRRIDLLIELQAESLALAPDNRRLDGVDVVKQHSNLLTLQQDLIALSAKPSRGDIPHDNRSEEHTSELQSLMRISYAVFCLKKKNHQQIRKKNSKLIKFQHNTDTTTPTY